MSQGDHDRSAPIVLTFDNLGEAAAIERGTWSGEVPIGSDPSVTEALPWLLDELDAHRLRATFFVEAINCEHNPAALREIAARGHELAVHGWRHELWEALAPQAERRLLARCVAAFAGLGLSVAGFRPPGGEPTAATAALLAQAGFDYWSPVDSPEGGGEGGPVRVPFEWELVDAYHLMERFEGLRVARGDNPAPQSPRAVGQRLIAALAPRGDRPRTLILHPFLMLDPEWASEVRGLLSLLADRASAGTTPVLTAGRFAWSQVVR